MARAPITRDLIAEAYRNRPRGASLTRDELAVATHRAHTTIAHATELLISDRLIENTSPRGHVAKYRLTPAGRQHLLGETAAQASEADEAQAEPETLAAPPQNVAPTRFWHAAATAPAAAGDLNPWAGVPLRAGALDAAALPSRGIKA